MEDIERFRSKCVTLENGCWQWTDSLATRGYGMIHTGETLPFAHKRNIAQLCRNRGCVNPDHLELVTAGE